MGLELGGPNHALADACHEVGFVPGGPTPALDVVLVGVRMSPTGHAVTAESVPLDGNHVHARTELMDVEDVDLSQVPVADLFGAGETPVIPQSLGTQTLGHAICSNEIAEGSLARENQTYMARLIEGMTRQEAVAFAKLKMFCSNVVKRLAPPLLKEVQASSLRPNAEPYTP